MLFVYPTPQYPRKPLEYTFKTLYLTVTTVHAISIAVLIADFYTRLRSSMPNYFTDSDLVIAEGIEIILANCTYSGQLHLQNVRGAADVSLGSVPYYLMTTAQYITALFVVEFLFVVNSGMAASMYSAGNRHLRFFGVHVPMYTILCCFAYFYCIALTVITWSFESNRQFFKRGLEYCADVLRQTNESAYYESEFDGTTIFTTAVYWPFAAACYSVVVYIIAFITLAYHSYDKATVLLSEADAPWEARGIMCTTSKPLLKLHTAQRNAIVDDARKAIQQGQRVRIVRSYQLMTEEDFEALVQAMRDQVAKLLKEQQFMKLKENFGDTESQIDQGGLFWRTHLMAPPPEPQEGMDGGVPMNGDELYGGQTPNRTGPNGEAYYDVDFGQYFDDNGAGRLAPVLPSTSASAVAEPNVNDVYVDNGLYPEEEAYDENGDGDGPGFYRDDYGDDGGADYDEELDGDGRFPDADFHDLDEGDGDAFESASGRPRHHSHRHHRRHTSSQRRQRGDGGADGGDYGDFLGEPEARRPLSGPLFDDGDNFSPAEGGYSGYDEFHDGGNGADALSDDFEL